MFDSHQKKRLALQLLALPLLASAAPACENITLSVTAHVDDGLKIDIPPLLETDDPDTITDILNTAVSVAGGAYPVVPVGGTYDIVATFCEPEVSIPDRADTLQILAPGATYTKEYWTGHDLPADQKELYSYAGYASAKGYHTLSLDRLGSGESSRPDPLLEVQCHLEAETMHEIAKMAKNGEIGGKQFPKLVYVGHSLGSAIGSIATKRHPADWDAVVLTGWSEDLIPNFPKVLFGLLLPAAVAKPEEFSDLPLPYLVFNNQAGVKNIFYSEEGTYDAALEDRDFNNRNTVSASELITVFNGLTPSSSFDRPVMLLVGEDDAVLCKNGHCKPGPENSPGSSASMFPRSSNFTYSIIPETGHCNNLHYSAPQTYKAAHDFIIFNVN